MIIKSAKVIICSPGRTFVTVVVRTNEGIYGIADATLNGRELAVVAYLEEYRLLYCPRWLLRRGRRAEALTAPQITPLRAMMKLTGLLAIALLSLSA